MYYILLALIIYFFGLLVLTKQNKGLSEILTILGLTFFTVIVGLRYGVGIDYFSYESMFNLYYDKSLTEPIYSLIVYTIYTTTGKFYHLTIVMAVITNTFIYLGLKKRNIKGMYLLLALFIYVSNMGAVFMNLMRQGVAVAIFFYASSYIEEKRFKKFILFSLIAAGFHKSALLLIPLYFLRPLFNKKRYYISVLLCYIIVYFNIAVILINFVLSKFSMYSHYYNSDFILNISNNILALGVMMNVAFVSCLLLLVKKDYPIDLNFYLLGTLINILAIQTFMFDRIGIYFFTFGIVAIPNSIKNIKDSKIRTLTYLLALLVTLIYFAQMYLYITDSNPLYYRSIFTK